MNERCAFCGHKHLSEKRLPYTYQRGGDMMVVEDVPCMECEFCGEQYFAATVRERIEKDYAAISGIRKKPHRVIHVPVEEYADL